MNLFWKSYIENGARQAKHGTLQSLSGLDTAWAHSLLMIDNGTFLSAPVAGEDDLASRLTAAAGHAAAYKLPWAFYVYEPYAAGLDENRITSLMAAAGLGFLLRSTVMTGNVDALHAPLRPLPELELRRAVDVDGIAQVFDINFRAYGMPLELTASVLESGAHFGDLGREFGFLGFVDGVAVSTASVMELDGWLYAYLVATEPGQQKKGYAEAVLRHALQAASSELGITRTSLDASPAGSPLYRQMGYHPTGESWSMYLAG